MEFSEINDCDRYCFENVRQLARAPSCSNPNWKRDLLQAIDRVRSDAEWQTDLRELYNVHLSDGRPDPWNPGPRGGRNDFRGEWS
jgi:hypothetical protein